MRVHLLFLGLLAACGGHPVDPVLQADPVLAELARQTVTEIPVESGGFGPVANWKTERKRRAMLGLRYDSGRVSRVEFEAREVLVGFGKPDIERLEHEARKHAERNDQLAAIAAWTRVALLEPSAGRLVALGRALRGFKMTDEAEAAFRTAIELDGDHVEALVEVALIDSGQGDLRAALAGLTHATRLEPDNGEPWARIARLHFLHQRDEEAQHAASLAIERGARVPVQILAALERRLDPVQPGTRMPQDN